MARKPTDIVQYKLRIRESLRRRIEQAAKKNGVSANQEMVGRLERSFELETQRKLDLVAEELAKQTRHLNEFVGILTRLDGDHWEATRKWLLEVVSRRYGESGKE
jgi:hypothetical protein